MRTGMRVLVAMSFLGLLLAGPRADAACHEFWISDANGDGGRDEAISVSVDEGNKLTLTIQRDRAVNESSVRVTTVNGTAKAPADFTPVDQRVSWAAQGGTEKKLTISTKEDTTSEQSEAFSVKVSDGKGCNPPNPNFVYRSPAKVTIKDDDATRTQPSTPAPVKTPAPRAVPLTTAATAPEEAEPTSTPKATRSAAKLRAPKPTPTFTALAVETEDDDGGFPWLPVAAVGGFLAAAGGALMLTRMRRGV